MMLVLYSEHEKTYLCVHIRDRGIRFGGRALFTGSALRIIDWL